MVSSMENFDIAEALSAAQTAYDAEQFERAAHLFQQAKLHSPPMGIENLSAKIGFGNSALALGHGDRAFDVFRTLPETGLPSDRQAEILAGLVLSEILSGKAVDAEVRLNDALELTHSDPRLWSALGRFYDGQGRWLAAQDCYLRALSTGRAQSSVVNNLGMSLLLQGRVDEALEKFDHALSLRPGTALYDNNRRMALVMQTKYQQAVAGLKDVRAAQIFNDAGFMAAKRGDTRIAKELFEAALRISPVYHAKAAANLEALLAGTLQSGT